MKKVLIDLNDVKETYSCGRNAAIKLGQAAGAVVMLGGKRLYRADLLEQYVKEHDVLLDRVRSN